MWSYSTNGACYTGASGEAIGQTGILTPGIEYLFSIEVFGMSNGQLRVDSFGIPEYIIENGLYQFSGVATIPDLSFTALDYGGVAFNGCIRFIYAIEMPEIKIYTSCDQLVYDAKADIMTVYKSNIKVDLPWDFPDNTYYVEINDSILQYKSECFRVGDHKCTLLLSWTNNDNGFGLDYEILEQINSSRVDGKLWHVKPDSEKTFFKYSNGEESLIYSETNLNQDLTIKALPEYLVKALGVGTAHDMFKIDGEQYIVPENIETSWRKSSQTTSVLMTVRKKTNNLINRNCK